MRVIRMDQAEARLVEAIRQLEFGEISPDEVVPQGREVSVGLDMCEEALLEAMAEWGTPRVVSVAQRRPVWAIFECSTPAGPAKKRIKLA